MSHSFMTFFLRCKQNIHTMNCITCEPAKIAAINPMTDGNTDNNCFNLVKHKGNTLHIERIGQLDSYTVPRDIVSVQFRQILVNRRT